VLVTEVDQRGRELGRGPAVMVEMHKSMTTCWTGATQRLSPHIPPTRLLSIGSAHMSVNVSLVRVAVDRSRGAPPVLARHVHRMGGIPPLRVR
jgi:hypothetical protein